MDDCAAGVKIFDAMIPALRKLFDCLRESRLKLSAHKCGCGTTKIDYIGSTITSKRISPKNQGFLEQVRMPNTVKQVKCLVGFVQFFRNFIPNLKQKLVPFFKLLRKKTAPQ